MSKEEKIARALGEYDGAMNVIRKASDEMFRMIPVNAAGETNAEALLQLNQWVERMESQARNKLTKAIIKIGE